MKTSRGLWLAALAVALVAGVATRVPASGIPTATPLFYAGTLEDGGQPVTGMRAFTLILWDSATATDATNKKCETTATSTQVTNGRFRIALDGGCTAAVEQNSDLFVEVVVGSTSLGRKKLGAVPYAVEAKSAVAAQTAVTASALGGAAAEQLVPAGAVMYFNLGACPTGWTELAAARGRYIVGVQSGGTLAGTVGSPLTNNEDRPTGQHAHTASSAPHSHAASSAPHGHAASQAPHKHGFGLGTTSGGFPWFVAQNFGAGDAMETNETAPAISVGLTAASVTVNNTTASVTVNNAGNVAGTNAPYIQLRACQKS